MDDSNPLETTSSSSPCEPDPEWYGDHLLSLCVPKSRQRWLPLTLLDGHESNILSPNLSGPVVTTVPYSSKWLGPNTSSPTYRILKGTTTTMVTTPMSPFIYSGRWSSRDQYLVSNSTDPEVVTVTTVTYSGFRPRGPGVHPSSLTQRGDLETTETTRRGKNQETDLFLVKKKKRETNNQDLTSGEVTGQVTINLLIFLILDPFSGATVKSSGLQRWVRWTKKGRKSQESSNANYLKTHNSI